MDVTCGPFECRAIAGRNSTHLAAVAESLAAAGGPSSSPAIIVAPLTVDPSPWVMRAHAVITAAGPFSVHGGEALVKACVQTGTHYADTSDEFYWQRRMIDRYDAGARSSGARIVLAAGFCVLAADLGAALALAPFPDGGCRRAAWPRAAPLKERRPILGSRLDAPKDSAACTPH